MAISNIKAVVARIASILSAQPDKKWSTDQLIEEILRSGEISSPKPRLVTCIQSLVAGGFCNGEFNRSQVSSVQFRPADQRSDNPVFIIYVVEEGRPVRVWARNREGVQRALPIFSTEDKAEEFISAIDDGGEDSPEKVVRVCSALQLDRYALDHVTEGWVTLDPTLEDVECGEKSNWKRVACDSLGGWS